MVRSMFQVFVKNSVEAAALYCKAFGTEMLCEYKNDDGQYMHSEMSVFGQILAISETLPEWDGVLPGNTMMFCLEMGEGQEDVVRKAYEVLKIDAIKDEGLVTDCGYSPLQFVLTDKYGVYWCVFV